MIHPKALIKLFGYNAELINKQLVGLTHAESLKQLPPEAKANCLNWLLGHIISARTRALVAVNQEEVWTDQERAGYRFGSSNHGVDGPHVLHIDRLLEIFNLSQNRLINGLSQMSYEEMCQLSGYKDNTVGDSLGFFQFHEAQHVGQIIYLAKYAGKKEIWLSD